MVNQTVRPLSDPPWIFVSHASADLGRVRQVKNDLEELGAAPLLFHLRALSQPEEFCPLIEREIRARNSFLFCESAPTMRSEWVQRERAAVAPLASSGTIKIGTINVEEAELELEALRQLVSRTRCFVSNASADQARGRLVGQALARAGFQTFLDIDEFPSGMTWADQIETEIRHASRYGFVVIIITEDAMRSRFVLDELDMSLLLGVKIVAVVFNSVVLPPQLKALRTVDASSDIDKALKELITTLYAWT